MVDGATGLSATSAHPMLALLRVGSVRYSAFYFVSYYGGIAAAGHGSLVWIAVAWFFCIVVCLGVELQNRYTDQVEDRINNPARTALCERVGYRRIKRLANVIWVFLVPLGVVWSWMWSNPQMLCLQLTVVFLAINYSSGLRLKTKRYTVYLALSATFLLPYFVGWGMFESFWRIPLQLLLVPLFIVSIAGMKDLTDLAGDRVIGYRSAFAALVTQNKGRRLLALVLAPHVALTLAVALGPTPARALVSLIFLPVSLLLAKLAPAAMSGGKPAVLREAMYHVWFAYISLALVLSRPTLEMFGGVLSAAAFWVFASQRLHWGSGFRWNELRSLLRHGAGTDRVLAG